MMYERWLETEQAFAQRTPIMQAEYALDRTSALSLYDGLLPRLREHRRFQKDKVERDEIEDYDAKVDARELEIAVLNHEAPGLKQEVSILK